MRNSIQTKVLLKIAVFSSTAIGILTMGPVYVVALTLMNIHFSETALLKLILISVVSISIFVFFFWLINIFLYSKFARKTYSSFERKRRYVWSYLLCTTMLLIIRLMTSEIFISPESQQRIINWKLRVFEINVNGYDIGIYKDSVFQVLIILFIVFSINTTILIFLDFYILQKQKNSIELENAELRIKNIEALNQQMRQQLQPHFLFNALNVLKSLIRRYPEKAEVFVKRLSDFLRSAFSNSSTNIVKLSDEIKLCNDYLEMQKIRFGDAIKFEFKIPDEVSGFYVPFFSIQILLENSIKHNIITVDQPLMISIYYSEKWLTVSNNLQLKGTTEENTGHGLANLSERYRMISADEIKIQNDGINFRVSIKILENEDCNY
jgi:sensor histidine kinase YesM